MRPPEFTGGNRGSAKETRWHYRCFNEAAGIHRRKRAPSRCPSRDGFPGFNEAAGIHRRKHPRRQDRSSRRRRLQ